ncbi:type I-E CRISPR-associated protein Cas5/CasD [Marinibacterium profundimaris]|uniref:type I-E CRISPR-associated protein Cas5/CasD n=1 Tax=Marinibacterium profundimaris TaxID=1679460 RepID=UPI000B5276C5|nr:type I-E CRISPR-associated protein Cas5/CasD [Marinibacterium profundimaris]
MRDHLVFTLTATLGAMGGPAGHDRRGSDGWPGRSAILGLLAAAKGIRRDGDFSALDALGVAVAVFDQGDHLRDFHTVQTVPTSAVKRPQSRPEALVQAGLSVNTMITRRDYRVAPLYGVAVWGVGLEALRDALIEPVFTLYLGRKSCPLACPVSPRIVPAQDPAAALAHIDLPPWRKGQEATLLAADAGAVPGGRDSIRHDRPTDRRGWHFAPRMESVAQVSIRPEGRE